jgi:CHRD domain
VTLLRRNVKRPWRSVELAGFSWLQKREAGLFVREASNESTLRVFSASVKNRHALKIIVAYISNNGRTFMNPKVLLAGASVCFMLPAMSLAETVSYKASLTGVQEVPANDSKGTGTAAVTYDTASKTLTWKVTYSGLTGPATAAHIHGPAEAGKNAPVAVPFPKPESPIEGSGPLTDAQAGDLAAGKLYVNVHTAANKGGEIRGQLTADK